MAHGYGRKGSSFRCWGSAAFLHRFQPGSGIAGLPLCIGGESQGRCSHVFGIVYRLAVAIGAGISGNGQRPPGFRQYIDACSLDTDEDT